MYFPPKVAPKLACPALFNTIFSARIEVFLPKIPNVLILYICVLVMVNLSVTASALPSDNTPTVAFFIVA